MACSFYAVLGPASVTDMLRRRVCDRAVPREQRLISVAPVHCCQDLRYRFRRSSSPCASSHTGHWDCQGMVTTHSIAPHPLHPYHAEPPICERNRQYARKETRRGTRSSSLLHADHPPPPGPILLRIAPEAPDEITVTAEFSERLSWRSNPQVPVTPRFYPRAH